MYDANKIGAEVYAVLKNIPESKYNQVPIKVIKSFEQYKQYANNIVIDTKKNFEEQNISKQAKDIIFAISLNYWLTEEERKKVIQKLNENEKSLYNKYNPDNLFKKKTNEIESAHVDLLENTNSTSLIENRESFFTKFKNFIFRILHINN